jgi:parallel beta-helix repeat protein
MAVVAMIALASQPAGVSQTVETPRPAVIRVGMDSGDIRGDDQRALQAAVDYVARLGGGTVYIGPGRYLMRNALTLHDQVRIVGEPGKTILVACVRFESRLAADGDCNERQITVEDVSGFRIGDGVAVRDEKNGGGFAVTTATLTGQVDARTFRISTPLYLDYMVSHKATARLAFPVVGGWNVKNVVIEGLTIDGQQGKAGGLDGCRGAGIYLFQCAAATIRNCVVRGYAGDGISFQVSEQVTVEDCVCEENTGLGLHPGSGSQRPILCRNRSMHNAGDGLFVCWRVQHGVFEDNEIQGNKGAGISIGHKDSDNRFRNNVILSNGGPGVLFRAESEPMGAHRNIFEGNRILDNGFAESDQATQTCIVINGHHHELVFRKNTIGRSQPSSGGAGIRCSKHAKDFQAADNEFLNVETEILMRDR